MNDVVYVEGAVGNIYLESAADLERYRRIFSRLQSIALSPEGSAAKIARIAATYEDGKIEVAAQNHSCYPQRRPEGTRKK